MGIFAYIFYKEKTVGKKTVKKNRQEGEIVPGDVYQGAPFVKRLVNEYPAKFPDVTSMDVLAILSDEEVYSRVSCLESDRQKVVDFRLDPFRWEVEIAYLRREMSIRKTRREAHEAWLKENASLVSEINENHFPDFEPTAYPA